MCDPLNLHFNYNTTLRYALNLKLAYVNSYFKIPKIKKTSYYYYFKNVDNIYNPSSFNYPYMFIFFFGRRAHYMGFHEEKATGGKALNFSVQLTFNRLNMYEVLSFFIVDVKSRIDIDLLKFGAFRSHFLTFYYIVKDLNLFSDRKTNVGLFYLDSYLFLKIRMLPFSMLKGRMLLNLFKL